MPELPIKTRKLPTRTVFLLLVGIGLGYIAGISSSRSTVAHADITEEPRREAFKAGSVINEPVLREIAATLLRIESKVERIEKLAGPPAAAKPVPKTTKK